MVNLVLLSAKAVCVIFVNVSAREIRNAKSDKREHIKEFVLYLCSSLQGNKL